MNKPPPSDSSTKTNFENPAREPSTANSGRSTKTASKSDVTAPPVSEARYRTLFECAPIGILYADAESHYLDANETICKMLGYSREELIGLHASDIVAPAEVQHIEPALNDISGSNNHQREWLFRRKDGSTFPAEVVATKFSDGTLLGMIQDVTLLRQHAREVARMSRLYDALSQINQAIVWVPARDELFKQVCRVLVSHGGFRLAWIDWHDEQAHRLIPLAKHGAEAERLDSIGLSAEDGWEGRIISRTAFRSGLSYISNSLSDGNPSRAQRQRQDRHAAASFPFRSKGVVCGTLNVFADQTNFFHDKEIALLEEAATDLSFALDNFARDAEREYAELTLRNEKRFSDTMIESMPGIVYFYDTNGRFLRWNRNFETVSGYSGAEIARMHPLDFFREQDRPLLQSRIAEVFTKNESSAEADFISKDGRATPYFFTGRSVEFENMPCLVGIGIDISERKQALDRLRKSEERFRELADTVQEVFWIVDPAQNRMLYISPAYEKIWGRSCASLYESPQTWLEAIHAEDRERVVRARLAKSQYDETYRILRPDGAVRWIHDRALPVRGAAGEVLRIVGTAADITQRRQLEEQFRQTQKIEAIGQLAGGVAHDFNNILSAILGNTQLALTDLPENHPVRESLAEIKKASLRAKGLVHQILTFARRQPQERKVTDLNATLQETFNFLRPTIPSGVDLIFSMDATTPPVLADATQVYQLIVNLCTNAWHALEHKPGRIEVKLEPVALSAAEAKRLSGLQPGQFARLSVTDNGKGMDAKTLERIFDPFFTTKGPGKGTGLGLSVVHGIVQNHEGAISVSSQPGRGAVFQVYFPAAATPADSTADLNPSPHRGSGEHILYVDDEEPLVFLAKRMLERLGYRLTGFTRAEDAFRAFRENPQQFDLVITDLNMPGINGLQVAAELLAVQPDIPIVLCSGYVTDELKQQAHDCGIREVLYKPNTMEEFGEAIHRLATEHRRQKSAGPPTPS